ncbi:MAG: winged helix-turn-helix domain-containing protein [Nanoarchaeota archaeon]|nr:winged helix-turn-helix domain-containing protein [Nanoarchaeota archaeon]
MKKIEQVFREMLYQAIECKNRRLTQLEISKKLKISLSTVNLAVKKLEKMGAVIIEKMGFRMIDLKKIIYYWASIRNLEKDIIYKTRLEMPVREIERNISDVVFAAYSAYKFKFKDVPADYSEVYVYADEEETEEIKKRFPENNKFSNLFVLKKDENMDKYGKICAIAQIFVDLWNIKQWYASDFLKALENKLNLKED